MGQALAFQAATYTLTDQLDQILQLVFVRRLDALKLRWSVVVLHIDASIGCIDVDRDLTPGESQDLTTAEIACAHVLTSVN